MTEYSTGDGQSTKNLVLKSGDHQYVGSATATTLTTATADNTDVMAGGVLDVREGTATNARVEGGGQINVLAGGHLTDVYAEGGSLTVDGADAVVNGLKIIYASVQVNAGTVSNIEFATKSSSLTFKVDLGKNLSSRFDKATGILAVTGEKGSYSIQLGSEPLYNIGVSPTDGGFTVAAYCFRRGTLITTPYGQMPVERLRPGFEVLTADRRVRSVTWVGSTTGAARGADRIVVVRANAFADGVPSRDLYVTPGHSFLFDGVLVPAGELVNHRSIVRDVEQDAVEVFHVELDRHDIILAEGASAESYRDDGNRKGFARSEGRGGDGTLCAPVVTSGRIVDRVWQRLSARADCIDSLDDDPDLHLIIDGDRVDPIASADRQYIFAIDRPAREIRLRSRTVVPAAVGLARDQRRLGVALRQSRLRCGTREQCINFDSRVLTDGFHEAELAAGFRWTDGAGRLPFDTDFDTATLMVEIGCTARYNADRAS